MSNGIPLTELESSPAAKFEAIGDTHRGRILSIEERQQTNTAGQPQTFDDGRPRTQYVISCEAPDGSTFALYAKGGKGPAFKPAQGSGSAMLVAITAAAKAAGATMLNPGDELAIAFTGLGEQQLGKSAAKLYTAQYRVAPMAAVALPVEQPAPAPAAPAPAALGDLFSS